MTDRPSAHPDDPHYVDRMSWLRAAVMGANDGIVSVGGLITWVAAASPDPKTILIAGSAGLVAGAMSMAAGEYVSVSSQADTENADLARERGELAVQPVLEHQELADIYVKRGLNEELARQVADELMAKDALAAHARDELGISEVVTARPIQAALTSAATFSTGALMPLLLVAVVPHDSLVAIEVAATLLFLALLGALGAWAGGARPMKSILRVTFWGALALAATAGIGRLFGTVV